MPDRSPSEPLPSVPPLALCAIGWLVPGGAHLWLGRRDKGIIFLVVLVALYKVDAALGQPHPQYIILYLTVR